MPDLEQRLAAHSGLIVSVFAVLFFAGLWVDAGLWRRWRNRSQERALALFRVAWRPWNWPDAALLVGLVAAAAVALRPLFPLLERWAGPHFPFVGLVVQAFGTHGVVIGAVLVLLRYRRIPLRSAFGGGSAVFLRDVQSGTLHYLGMIPLFLPLLLVNAGFMQVLGIDPSLQPILDELGGSDSLAIRVFLAVWAVAVAPVAEEILFRGIGLPVLLQRLPPVFAIALVSLLFAVLHLHAPAALPLFGLSVALSMAYLATGSLVVAITMHALFNAMTTALVLLAS